MASQTHSTDQNRSLKGKLDFNSFPAVRLFKGRTQDRIETAARIYTEGETLPPSRRLIVILPDANHDIFSLPKKIWNLAAPDSREVLLLTKPCRDENEFRARMNLSSLASQIRDPRFEVQSKLVLGALDQTVRRVSQPDDVIVCFEEHTIPGFLKRNRLADVLAQAAKVPVYTLRGAVSEMTDPISDRVLDVTLFLIAVAMLIGFFALEIWVDHNTTGTFRTVVEVLVVFLEIWIVAACVNRSFKI